MTTKKKKQGRKSEKGKEKVPEASSASHFRIQVLNCDCCASGAILWPSVKAEWAVSYSSSENAAILRKWRAKSKRKRGRKD
jgi:hypothetical protein